MSFETGPTHFGNSISDVRGMLAQFPRYVTCPVGVESRYRHTKGINFSGKWYDLGSFIYLCILLFVDLSQIQLPTPKLHASSSQPMQWTRQSTEYFPGKDCTHVC